MTVIKALTHITEQLQKAGHEQAQYEARELLKAITGLSASDLITKDSQKLTAEQQKNLTTWVEKRAQGVPLAYLAGVKGFFKHMFVVEAGVLVPRPETEQVVEVCLRRAAHIPMQMKRVADLGSGTGCIGLSIIYEWEKAELWAVDPDKTACSLTKKNAEKLKVDTRTHVECVAVENWKPGVKFDLIAANPPYIPAGDPKVQKSVHDHEPHAALYAGPDGLDCIRKWVPVAHDLLNKGGMCVLEIGAGQNQAVRVIMDHAGFQEVEVNRDLAGIERVVSAIRVR